MLPFGSNMTQTTALFGVPRVVNRFVEAQLNLPSNRRIVLERRAIRERSGLLRALLKLRQDDNENLSWPPSVSQMMSARNTHARMDPL
jgi:hypothetical protein